MFLIFDRNKNIICLFLIMKYFEMLFQIVWTLNICIILSIKLKFIYNLFRKNLCNSLRNYKKLF